MEIVKGLIDIVIPNNNRNIDRIINALILSTYEKWKLYEVNKGLERSVQRNMGINEGKGEFILILDSDQVPDIKLLAECVEMMKDYDTLYIPETIPYKDWFSKIRDYERQFYTGTAVDCVRFVRRPCPMFDETMSGPEDSDWDRRIKGRRGITKNVFYHYDDVNILTYFKKKAYYSKSMKRFEEKHPKDRVLRPHYRCLFIFLENWRRIRPIFFWVMVMIFVRGVIYKLRNI
jgi:hypothetical protein